MKVLYDYATGVLAGSIALEEKGKEFIVKGDEDTITITSDMDKEEFVKLIEGYDHITGEYYGPEDVESAPVLLYLLSQLEETANSLFVHLFHTSGEMILGNWTYEKRSKESMEESILSKRRVIEYLNS